MQLLNVCTRIYKRITQKTPPKIQIRIAIVSNTLGNPYTKYKNNYTQTMSQPSLPPKLIGKRLVEALHKAFATHEPAIAK